MKINSEGISGYLRHLVFGVIIGAVFIYARFNSPFGLDSCELLFAVGTTLLYPFSRFIYGRLGGIMGDEIFTVTFPLALGLWYANVLSMLFCWLLAAVIIPVWLIYRGLQKIRH